MKNTTVTALPSGLVCKLGFKYGNPLYMGIYSEILKEMNARLDKGNYSIEGIEFFRVEMPPSLISVTFMADWYEAKAPVLSAEDFEAINRAVSQLPTRMFEEEEIKKMAFDYCSSPF